LIVDMFEQIKLLSFNAFKQQIVAMETRLIQSCPALKLSSFISDIFPNISTTKGFWKNETHQKAIFLKSTSLR